jgi:hypothetical protein
MQWLLIVILVATSVRLSASELADETVRYVNDQIISLGDVFQRNQERISVDKGITPSGMSQWMSFSRVSLEELTDEELLVQYAKEFAEEHHFQLLDHERITQQVLERARTTGRTLTLHEQALQRKAIERRQSIDFIMGFLEIRAATIGPIELMHDYEVRAKEFYRPPRAKLLEIVLRPTGLEEKKEVKLAKLAVFKRCQDAGNPMIKKVVDSRLDAYLSGSPEVQAKLLDETIATVAALDGTAGLDQASSDLVKAAVQAQAMGTHLRDADATFHQLSDIRTQIEGKGVDAFKAAARASSQGPGASDGGDRGWLEPGSEGKDFDQVVFALKPGELSPVFRAGELCCLVLVTETVAARSREFAEVTAELEATEKPKRMAILRREAITMLRAKASIRDVASLDKLRE